MMKKLLSAFVIFAATLTACAQTYFGDLPNLATITLTDSVTIVKSGITYRTTVGVILQPFYDTAQVARDSMDSYETRFVSFLDTTDAIRVDVNKDIDSLAVHLDSLQAIRSDVNGKVDIADTTSMLADYALLSEVGGSYTAGDGLSLDGTEFNFGGPIGDPGTFSGDTYAEVNGSYLSLMNKNGSNGYNGFFLGDGWADFYAGPESNGANIQGKFTVSMSGSDPYYARIGMVMKSNGSLSTGLRMYEENQTVYFEDGRTTKEGIVYTGSDDADWTDTTLVTKGYVDDLVSTKDASWCWNFVDDSQFVNGKWGAWFNPGKALVIDSCKVVAQGGSPNMSYNICFNDSINYTEDYTNVWTSSQPISGADAVSIGVVSAAPDNPNVPLNDWVMIEFLTLTVKPVYGISVNVYAHEQ